MLDTPAEQGSYHGLLPHHDPLFGFFVADVLPRILDAPVSQPEFEVYALHPAFLVARYHERSSKLDLVCKFYGNKLPSNGSRPEPEYFLRLLEQEYSNMQQIWELGFDRPPYRIVQPLAINPAINFVLVEEFVAGPKLDAFFKVALDDPYSLMLEQRLDDLAGFLAHLHTRSSSDRPLRLEYATGYFGKLIDQLIDRHVLRDQEPQALQALRHTWAQRASLTYGTQALLHGDATPVNFVFGAQHEVVAIDLERVHWGDPYRDVGCVMAEILHTLRLGGQHDRGRALAQRFATTYQQRVQNAAPPQIAQQRLALWTGLTLLRICRNDWLDMLYRRELIQEAWQWLK